MLPNGRKVLLLVAILGTGLALIQGLRFVAQKSGLTVKERPIIISSQLPKVELKFSNQKQFLQKLEAIGFWKSSKVADLRKQNEKLTAKSIAIIITSAAQVPDPYFVNTDGNSKQLFAFGSTVDKLGLVTFYIGLDDIYLLPKNTQATENLINALLLDAVQIIANSTHLTTRTLEQVTSQSAPKYLELNIAP